MVFLQAFCFRTERNAAAKIHRHRFDVSKRSPILHDSPRLVDSFFDGRRDRLAQQVSALKPPGVFRHAGGKAVEDGFFGFNKKGDLQNIEKNMEDLF